MLVGTGRELAVPLAVRQSLPGHSARNEREEGTEVRHRDCLSAPGSLANADPAAELPMVLQALDGEVVARGPKGERTIAASALFCDAMTTSLAPDEIPIARLEHRTRADVGLDRVHDDAPLRLTDGARRRAQLRDAVLREPHHQPAVFPGFFARLNPCGRPAG